LTNIKFKSKY